MLAHTKKHPTESIRIIGSPEVKVGFAYGPPMHIMRIIYLFKGGLQNCFRPRQRRGGIPVRQLCQLCRSDPLYILLVALFLWAIAFFQMPDVNFMLLFSNEHIMQERHCNHCQRYTCLFPPLCWHQPKWQKYKRGTVQYAKDQVVFSNQPLMAFFTTSQVNRQAEQHG